MNTFENYASEYPSTDKDDNQLTNECLKKAQEIALSIISSHTTNPYNGNITYIISWDEPYQGANVVVTLEYTNNDGWFLHSSVWCRKPQKSIKTPLPYLSEDTVQKWLTDFIIKYKLYKPYPGKHINTSYLSECLMKNEL